LPNQIDEIGRLGGPVNMRKDSVLAVVISLNPQLDLKQSAWSKKKAPNTYRGNYIETGIF
jgi:hypothetical protein